MRKLIISLDEFVERVNNNYNGRITIVKESYTGIRNKVTAYCSIHKIYFSINAHYLSVGHGNCPECTKEIKRQQHIKPWGEVYKSFIEAYGEKFSYDESSYHGRKELMKVHCNDCGEDFEITPEHHLKYNNGGCPNCHKTKTVKCSKCGKEIQVDRHCGENVICEDCYKRGKRLYNIKTRLTKNNKNVTQEEIIKEDTCCKICGRKLNENLECDNEFCKKHNFQQFESLIRYFSFDESKYGTIEVEEEFNRVRNILYEMYWVKNMTPFEICKVWDYPKSDNLLRNIFRS